MVSKMGGWTMGPADNLSPADIAAIAAIAQANVATNKALAELARTIAARNGVVSDEPAPQLQPDKLRQKSKSYRLTNLARDENGNLDGNVETDGRVRRFRVSRDEDGELVGEVDELPAPAPEAAPASSVTPEPGGTFADVFGSIEGLG
jgi:hypothetical protein